MPDFSKECVLPSVAVLGEIHLFEAAHGDVAHAEALAGTLQIIHALAQNAYHERLQHACCADAPLGEEDFIRWLLARVDALSGTLPQAARIRVIQSQAMGACLFGHC